MYCIDTRVLTMVVEKVVHHTVMVRTLRDAAEVIIFANWRGFSGGTRGLAARATLELKAFKPRAESLKFGRHGIYLEPQGQGPTSPVRLQFEIQDQGQCARRQSFQFPEIWSQFFRSECIVMPVLIAF